MKLKATHLVLARCFALSLGLSLALTAHAQLNNPNGIAFDTAGNLWVANSGANQVLEMDPTTGVIRNTIAQDVSSPTRLAFAGEDLYVTNLGTNNVTVYNTRTLALEQTISSTAINRPLGVAVDAYGDVYIADNASTANNVIALNIGGGLVETLTKDNSGYQFIGPGALTIHGKNIYAGFGRNVGENAVISYNVGEFLTGDPQEIVVFNDNVNTGPTGVAFDSKGYVYISEYTSGTAVKYAPNNGKNPVLVINQGTGGCEGIAVDRSGNIYVSNSIFNDITVYNSSGELINTLM
ncbi:MAG: NHL repeat-containing protein [Bryobacteraceae bacterium]